MSATATVQTLGLSRLICMAPATMLFVLVLGALGAVAHAAKLLASHYSGLLYTLELSEGGGLAIVDETPAGARLPAWMTLDGDSETVYVVDESWSGAGTLAAFSVGDHGLAESGTAQTKGGDIHSCLYGDDKFMAVANYDGSYISTYSLPLSGAESLQTITLAMNGTGPVADRQDKPHPHAVIPDPTGAFLLAPDLGADVVRIFRIADAAGRLTPCGSAPAPPGAGPRHAAFASLPSRLVLYTVNELGNSVSAWHATYPSPSSPSSCLALSLVQTISTFPPDATPPRAGAKAAEVHVRDGFVYATNRFDGSFGDGAEDSLAVFRMDATTGELALSQFASAHASFPRTFAINRAGDLLAVGGQTSANVAVLARNATSGRVEGLVASLDVGAKGTVNQEDGLSAVVWLE